MKTTVHMLRVLVLLALLLSYGRAQAQVNTGGGSLSLPTTLNATVISPNCSGTGCLQISASAFAQVVTDATTTSGSSTITCPNSDCNFASTDVGKTVWATTPGTGVGVGFMTFTQYACPISTIATVNSAQSITLAATNDCIANQTANAILIWGTKEGAALHTLDGSGATCATIYAPSNTSLLIDQAEFITLPSCATGGLSSGTGVPNRSLIAPPGTNFTLIPTPDFNYATCTGGSGSNVCIGSGLAQMQNVLVWGTGLQAGSSPNNTNCSNFANKIGVQMSANAGYMFAMDVAGWCPGATGAIGVSLNSTDEQWNEGGAQESGIIACDTTGKSIQTFNLDCLNTDVTGGIGLQVESGAQQTDTATSPYVGANVIGTLISRGTTFVAMSGLGAVAVQSGGLFMPDRDFVGSTFPNGTTSLVMFSGSTTQAINTQFGANAAATAITGSGTFNDIGGNKVTQGLVNVQTGVNFRGAQVLNGSCTGTVTSAATVGLYNAGQNAATTCTSTTVNLGRIMGSAGTLEGLVCNAGTGGNQTADACKVLKNGVATTLTCSLNGVTFCTDNSHTTAYAYGDNISIEVVAGTSTTLANVTASVLTW